MSFDHKFSMNKEHKATKFLTVVWGKKYIDRFLSLSLPSFLAPGNIPALVEATDLEVVIMTKESDIKLFKSSRSFKILEPLCHVRFVNIDDLIADGLYSITLTLAYARPIIACGTEMLNTHFIFMNADFVLADGSLKSLAKHIHDDRSIVLGTSYRSIAEELEPALENMVDSNDILNVPSRTLVGMALQHPHRTTVAKTYMNGLLSSTHPNQLFWKVDDHTVLGRYFLSFMLCIKPERIIKEINCFCDYALIPELCPSGDEVMMCDSDEFFMLELQSRTQETEMLKIGSVYPKEIATSLMEWMTPEHLRGVSYDIVFHADEIPSDITKTQAIAEEVIAEIRRHLGKLKSHRNHHYWVQGVAHWKTSRTKHGLSSTPPELASSPFNLRAKVHLSFHRMVTFVKEIYSKTNPYHQVNQLRRELFEDIRRSSSTDQRMLVVGELSFAKAFCSGETGFDIESTRHCLNSGHTKKHHYDHIIYLPNATHLDDDRLFHKMLELLDLNGSLHIFFSCKGVPMTPGFLRVVFSNLLEYFDLSSNTCEFKSVSNRPLHLCHRTTRLIQWRGSLHGRILLSPMILASIMANYLTRSGTIYNKYPVAVWLRVKPPYSYEDMLCHHQTNRLYIASN